jgi:two-component system, NarL family, response regulator NreC
MMLVDDHNVLRAGLKLVINMQPDMEVIAEANNSGDVLFAAEKSRPDVVVLDLSLPGGPSLPLIEKLRALPQAPKVLILSMHDDPAYVRAALAAGAKGYVVKTIGERELLESIRSVQQGRLVVDLDDEILSARVFESTIGNPSEGMQPVPAKLSARELEVLKLLGQGFTNQNIADQLEVSPKTVATYRARIADKLGLKTTAEFVKYCVDTGMAAPKLD